MPEEENAGEVVELGGDGGSRDDEEFERYRSITCLPPPLTPPHIPTPYKSSLDSDNDSEPQSLAESNIII